MPERRVVPCLCDASIRQRVIKDSNRRLEAKLGSKVIEVQISGFLGGRNVRWRGSPLSPQYPSHAIDCDSFSCDLANFVQQVAPASRDVVLSSALNISGSCAPSATFLRHWP
jgi:hypothetical protein